MDKEILKGYLEKGTDIAGGAVGGAIGLIGGPAGAILGGSLGVAISIGVKDFINRQLSNRQEVRVAASTVFALNEIRKRVEHGEIVRSDNFFDNSTGRSSAEELFEGVLLKCKDQYQEKKIFYISKIFEKTIFDSNISADTANQILSIVENFTYRKLCIIAFFLKKNEFDKDLLMKEVYSWYPDIIFRIELEILKQDIFDLVNLGIIDQKNFMMLTKNEVIPFNFELTTIGQLISKIMDLHLIPMTDLNPIYTELQYKEEFGISQHGKRNGS